MINPEINELCGQLVEKLGEIQDVAELVECLNYIRSQLHELSPLKQHPVDCVLWVDRKEIHANEWNPNHVAPPEMSLLYTSIKCDGYTQPIVTGLHEDKGYEIVDGFHRYLIPAEHKDIMNNTLGYLPVAQIDRVKSDRMASTIRHNRARGTHEVELMGNIVKELHDLGRSDEWIAKHLGMDADEILRLKQITGLADLFTNEEFSEAWEDAE